MAGERHADDRPQVQAAPTFLPAVHGYELAVRSAEATGRRRGGDWSEAVVLADGRLAVAIGDLVGGGASATAITMLRGALVSALLAGDEVGTVLRRLDVLASRIPEAVGGTVVVAVLDPVKGVLSCGSAGHPWPVLVSQNRPVSFLTGSCGVPLSTSGERAAPQIVPLAVGDAVVLYTDGVLSGRDRSPEDADAEFLAAAEVARIQHLSAGQVTQRLLDVMLPAGRPAEDDAVLMVVRAGVTGTTPFRLEVPALPEQLGQVRRALSGWMTAAGIGADDAMAIQLSVGEALANSVEHAYRGRPPGRVVISAFMRDGGQLLIEVSDDGSWLDTDVIASAHRGRGLQLIRASMADVRLERDRKGTTVRMTCRLSGETRTNKPAPADWAGTDAVEVEVLPGTKPVGVRLAGELDAANAEEVRDKVQRISRGGSVAVRLDLLGLEYLDSFAVRTLFELAMAAEASRERLSVTVRRGSPIARVLTASGFGQLAEITYD
jgi:anti-anti-sigma factor